MKLDGNAGGYSLAVDVLSDDGQRHATPSSRLEQGKDVLEERDLLQEQDKGPLELTF